MKKAIRTILGYFGYEIYKTGFNSQTGNMSGAIARLRSIGVSPKVVVDIGAAKGSWTEMALNRWPSASYYLIEPLKEQISFIPNNYKENRAIKIVEAVAGKQKGFECLTVSEDLDGSGLYGQFGENTRKVDVVAVDDLLENEPGEVLLKLDTHGFEIPIFEGSQRTLKRTAAIIVEVYGFHVGPQGKLFHELSAYLSEKGFRLFDIVDLLRRSEDLAFWQADAVYLRDDHKVFSSKSFN